MPIANKMTAREETALKGTHENFSREERAEPGSVRGFAVTIAVALGFLGALNAWRAGRAWPWLLGVAAVLVVCAYFAPALLRPLNVAWFRLGLVLHAIVNPLVMGLLFFVAIFPTALVMRIMGSNLLRLKRPGDAQSYWIARRPPGPAPESLKDQF